MTRVGVQVMEGDALLSVRVLFTIHVDMLYIQPVLALINLPPILFTTQITSNLPPHPFDRAIVEDVTASSSHLQHLPPPPSSSYTQNTPPTTHFPPPISINTSNNTPQMPPPPDKH